MAQDPRKRQKALERKAARASAKKKALRREKQATKSSGAWERSVVREAAKWPIHEALLSEEWKDTRMLTQILVARRSPVGEVVTGTFLVDLGCLGVKKAFAGKFDSVGEYETLLRRDIFEQMPMAPADLNLIAKILREAVAYAKDLGFEPDPDYHTARLILGDADPDASPEAVPLGFEGKPFYVNGPDDDPERVLAVLTRKLGPDGFNYELADPELMFELEERDRAGEEDDDEEDGETNGRGKADGG